MRAGLESFCSYMAKEAQVGPGSFDPRAAEELAGTLGSVPEPSRATQALEWMRGKAQQYPRATQMVKWHPFGGLAHYGMSQAYHGYAKPRLQEYGEGIEKAVRSKIEGEPKGALGSLFAIPGMKARASETETGARTLLAPEQQLKTHMAPADYARAIQARENLSPAQREALQQGGARMMRANAATNKEIGRKAGAFWDANRGWMIPAGIGALGLGGILAAMFWPRRQQQAPAVNVNFPEDPDEKWQKEWRRR